MSNQNRPAASTIPRPERDLRPEPEEDELPPGRISQRRFAAVMGTASAVLVFSAITFFSVGMVVGAALGPGIGGFVAQFDNVSYTDGDAKIYPVLAAHPACDGAPQLEADLVGTTDITGKVVFYKDLPLPDSSFASDEVARISIFANSGPNPIQAKNLNLRFTALAADTLRLGGTAIREFGPNQYDDGTQDASFSPVENGSLNPSAPNVNVPEYGINASVFELPNGGKAAAHEVSFDSISLQDLDLAVVIDKKSSLTNPVTRVVEPNNRTCNSLVDST